MRTYTQTVAYLVLKTQEFEEFLDAEKLFDEAAELGIDPRGMDDATFDAALSEARSRRQQALEQEAVGNEISANKG